MEEENILFETAENNNMELEENIIEHDTIDQQEIWRIKVPFHRMNPLKASWDSIVALMTDKMQLLLRMNLKTR